MRCSSRSVNASPGSSAMTDPKSDPARRCMPLNEWPKLDRQAWATAIADGDILDGEGPAAHWSQNTRHSAIAGYGRFLTFLERSCWLDRDAGPGERLSEDRLRAYIHELAVQVAPVTVAGRVRNLAAALRVMALEADYPYLRRARQRLKLRARPSRNKRARLVPIQDLFDLGVRLIRHAEQGHFDRELWRACCYRDGLCIMLLACRPIRRGNLAMMRLGRHLLRSGEAYALAFDEQETKNHRRYDRPLDAALTPYIERYLSHYRPLLLGGRCDDHVWISWRGIPMSEANLYGRIVARTREAFGHAIPPHMFRDAAVTSLGEDHPELTWLSLSLLHHSDPRIAQAHYDHARSNQAVKSYQQTVSDERRKLGKTYRQRRNSV